MSDAKLVQISRREKFAEDEFWTMMSALYEQQRKKFLQPQLPIEDLPSKVAKNFVTPPDAPVPDCLTCGACCTFLFVVGLNPTDQVPAENVWDVTQRSKENQEIVIDRFLRRDEETLHCTALDTTESNRAVCRIYEQRPRPCHNFEAGSDKCHGLRRLYGFEPALTLMEMFSAVQFLEAKAATPISPAKIRRVKIVENAESDELTIMAVTEDSLNQPLHSFDPNREFWMQFEFAGLTLAAARDLIDSRTNALKRD
ncbi:MAG: YkgJ family cysteine cluster protein [Pyrinomonadaceae bacterium]